MKISRTKKIALAGVIIVGLGLALTYCVNVLTTKSANIDSVALSNVASGGVLYRDNEQTNQSSVSSIQANPGEKVEYHSREIPIETKANAAVLSWKQSSDNGIKLEVRTKNGSVWSQWTEVQADEPGKDVTLADFSSTLVLAKNIDDFQYRFMLSGAKSEPSASVDLSNSKIVAIDSSDGPDGKEGILDTIGAILSPTTHASTAAPSIITREQWGNPEPNWSSWPPEYAKLGRVILHHTATTESGNSYADVRAIWQYHARTLEWGDIGYHYIIDSQGRIFEGRYYDKDYATKNNVEVIGGHAYGSNVGTVGVSMIGNYQDQTPTNAALDSMSKITGYKLAQYGIDPSGNGPFGEAVVGHYQVYSTACPGTNIINRFGIIKSKASEYYNMYVLENFTPLNNPRWMQIKGSGVTKIDVTTGQPVGTALAQGQQIKFVDKILVDGKWYLRTEYNHNDGGKYGVEHANVEEIPYVAIQPEWMTFTTDGHRSHPASRIGIAGDRLAQGTSVKVVDTITVNGNLYYRTEYNHNNNQDYGIHSRYVTGFAPVALESPRNFCSNSTINKINPQTGAVISSLSGLNQIPVNKKTLINGIWYYQSQADNGTLGFFDRHNLKQTCYVPFEDPRNMQLNKDATRINPYTNEPYDSLSKGQVISLSTKILINNEWFYRTTHNTQNNIDAVIPASAFSML